MKASLIGTVFLFACIFGQNSPANQGNVQLVQNLMPCSSTEECQLKVGPTSKCKDHTCMCPMGGKWRDCLVDESVAVMATQARQLNPGSLIGYRCDSDEKCTISHSYCHIMGKRGKCDCEEGFIPSHDNLACYKIAEHLNDFCFEDRQCLKKLKNSTCTKARKCECQDNYHVADHQCWKTVGYEEPCENEQECSKMEAHCNEGSKICVCDVSRIINNKRTFCLELVGDKERCFEDIQCALNNLQHSQCISGNCNCKSRYHYSNLAKNCIKDKVYGERCEDEECYENTGPEEEGNSLICNRTRYCDCAKDFKLMDNKCFKDASSSSKISLYPMSLILMILFLFLL